MNMKVVVSIKTIDNHRHTCLLLVFLLITRWAQAQEIINTIGDKNPAINTLDIQKDTIHIKQLIEQGNKFLDPQSSYPDSALYLNREAFNHSKAIGYRRGIVHALNNIGIYYFRQKQYDKSRDMFLTALQQAEQSDISDKRSAILFNMGLCYARKGMYDKSIAAYRAAIKDYKAAKDDHVLMQLYSELGVSYHYKGQYDLAVYYYYKILASQETINTKNYGFVIDAYNRLGVIWLQMKLFDQALAYYNKGEQIARIFNDSIMLVKILVNKASLYSEQNNTTKAYQSYIHVHTLAKQIGAYGVQQVAATDIANLLTQQGKPEEALVYAKEALALSKETDGIDDKINTYFALGNVYFCLKQYKLAEQYLLPAIEEMEQNGLTGNANNAYEVLASVYAAMGRYEEALVYERAFSRFNDSLRGTENARAINNQKVRDEIAQKDKALTEKQSQLHEKNVLLVSICISSLLLVTTLISIYRNNRHKQRLQKAAMRNMQKEGEISHLKARIKGEEQERNRIAHELHDGIGSQLYAAKLNADALYSREAGTVTPEELGELLRQLNDASKDLRRTAHNLMPDLLLQEGLAVAIPAFCSKTEKITHLEIDFLAYGAIPRLDADIELSIYRMIQELIQNILKHAKATQVLVQLSCENELLNVTVEDNGIGFISEKEEKRQGRGLKNIRTRVQAMHGQIDIKSDENRGTAIYLEFDISRFTAYTLVDK